MFPHEVEMNAKDEGPTAEDDSNEGSLSTAHCCHPASLLSSQVTCTVSSRMPMGIKSTNHENVLDAHFVDTKKSHLRTISERQGLYYNGNSEKNIP